MKKRFFTMLTLGIKQFRDPYYQGFAGQLSFYFMLSLVPVIILISQILGGIFGSSLDLAVDWILQYTKGVVAEELNNLLSYEFATGNNILLLLIALWASSRAQFAMMRITNFTFTEGRSTGRGYWRERFRAVITMFLTLLAIIFSLLVLVYGEQIFGLVLGGIGAEKGAAEIWLKLRWPVAALLYFLMISYNYYTLPTQKIKFREVIPGSIFASLGLLIVTLIFATYVGRIAAYDILYGSLASIVALLFWFYFLAWVLCLGVLFNKVWRDTGENGKNNEDNFV
ncbi:MAG TPA: YihY/virulence factor BrkB family protein [Bacillota bacterium]|nr:YihY/virulence factor BrkB family protein [Bacillota bacterium]